MIRPAAVVQRRAASRAPSERNRRARRCARSRRFQILDRDDVVFRQIAPGRAPGLPPPITTASTPSISARRTYTRWSGWRYDILADVVGADRQLALSAIDQHRELNRFGPAEISQRGERGAHRAAGIEHVVNQHHAGAIDGKRDVAADEPGSPGAPRPSSRYEEMSRVPTGVSPEELQFRSETVGETRAAAHDADQCERAGVAVALLDDFVGDALDAAGDGLGVEGGR